jgi:hypothetical protein
MAFFTAAYTLIILSEQASIGVLFLSLTIIIYESLMTSKS